LYLRKIHGSNFTLTGDPAFGATTARRSLKRVLSPRFGSDATTIERVARFAIPRAGDHTCGD